MKKKLLSRLSLFVVLAMVFTMVFSMMAWAAETAPTATKYCSTTQTAFHWRYVTGQPSSTNVLSYGTYGQPVKAVQGLLNKAGYPVGTPDGYFGIKTLNEVVKFQANHRIQVTGKVGAYTYQKLKEAAGVSFNSGTSTTTAPAPVTQSKPVSTPAPTTKPAPVAGLTADEQKMVDLVNAERTSRGLKPLQVDMRLVKIARMKSQDMIDKNYFDHQSPTYGSPFDMMRNAGISCSYAGENIAGAPSVDIAHTNLMNSAGHRANILSTNYTHIGIGIVDGGPYGKMFTQEFIG